MTLSLLTGPTDRCLTLDEVKLHLRVDGDAEDTLIGSLIAAAEQAAEGITGSAVMPQTWLLTLDGFPSGGSPLIGLRRPPVRSVESIDYLDQSGMLATLAPGAFQAYLAGYCSASVGPAYGATWPACRRQPEAVQISFTCGYPSAAAVPEQIKAWMKMRIGTLYNNRESDVIERGSSDKIGFVDYMLDAYRVWEM